MTENFGRTDEELATLPIALAPNSFTGQTVLVTGAGTGIGKATAYVFARLGANLVLAGRRPEPLEKTAAGLNALGAKTLVHPLNIRDPAAVAALYEAALAEFATLDILVNNAGGQFPQAAIDFSPKGWNAVIDTNLNGPWYMMQAAAQHWRATNRPGRIINVVAVVTRGMPGVAHTCAARAGIIHLSKTVAVEWAPLNIRVNCVAPGIINTEGMNAYSPEALAKMRAANAQRRMGHPEDIANAITYLASQAATFITGEVLTIDGGFQLWGDQWTIPEPAYFL